MSSSLSIARAREILGDEAGELTDDEVRQLIGQLETITDLMQDPAFGQPHGSETGETLDEPPEQG